MDAPLASAVSDETSPTRRESPVQFKQRLVIAFVRRTDGLQILASDRTFPADHLFRPFRDGAPISFEPNVREHPRPAAVAVEEGVDAGEGIKDYLVRQKEIWIGDVQGVMLAHSSAGTKRLRCAGLPVATTMAVVRLRAWAARITSVSRAGSGAVGRPAL